MRPLRRNKQRIYYALYSKGNPVPILDQWGNETGEYKTVYGKPVELLANVSASRGNASEDMFGISAVYDKALNPLPLDCPIDEYSLLWVDRMPVLEFDGSTKTPHDYVVERVARSLNHKAYAVRRVEVSKK